MIAVPLIWNLEHVVNISPHLINDVKILFSFIFINFLLSTLSTVFTVATFIKNKLYLSSIANIVAILAKVLILIAMFGTLPPMVWYVGLGTCAMTRSYSLPIGYIQKSWCLNFVSSATLFCERHS